jgi:hypothetical protein
MRQRVLSLLLLLGCESPSTGSSPSATATAAPAASSAVATAAPTATASVTAAAAPAVDPCKSHGLSGGGSGTRADMCKFDEPLLRASYARRIDEGGAVIRVDNPWKEEVTVLSANVYYYDAAGKQLAFKVGDKDHRVAKAADVAVKIPGSGHAEVALGLAKKDLPAEVDTVQVEVRSFGWEGDAPAFFASTAPHLEYRGIDGGDGPTGIGPCDAYREMLESCPKRFPDARAAMQKSLRQYNNAAPAIQTKLAEGLTGQCEKGIEQIKEKCVPE